MKAIVVVGASAGGMNALRRLVEPLPSSFDAAILVVRHLPAHGSGVWVAKSLQESTSLHCAEAKQGEKVRAGRVYLAPADQHLMVTKGKILLTKGARENRSRPSIDCLFRSAAVAYRNRVIGIVLTGYLDDGSSGLDAIDRCGGTCLVQDPVEADHPDMPRSALRLVKHATVLPIAGMAPLLLKLLQRKPRKLRAVPRDIEIESRIAMRVLSDVASVDALGTQVPFNCPGCGGVLWQVDSSRKLRFRCHTGHSYSANDLLADQTAKIEETLWVALRMFEERRNLVARIGERETRGREVQHERMAEAEAHIERIRGMLKATSTLTAGNALDV